MSNCIVFGINEDSPRINEYLEYFQIKKDNYFRILDRISGGIQKEKQILLTFSLDDEFKKYFVNNNGKIGSVHSFESKLKNYYKEHTNSIHINAAKDIGDAKQGFDSQISLNTAQRYCGFKILNTIRNYPNLKGEKVIAKVIEDITNELQLIALPFVNEENGNSENVKTYLTIKDDLDKLISNIDELQKKIDTLQEERNNIDIDEVGLSEDDLLEAIDRLEEINSLIKENNVVLKELKTTFRNNNYNLYLNYISIINEFGTNVHKNFANLVSILNNPERLNTWFNSVFNVQKDANLSRDYKHNLDDEDSIINAIMDLENDRVEEELDHLDSGPLNTGWDKEYASFTKIIDGDVKLYLSTIPVLSSNNINKNAQLGDNNRYDLDTNNSLGVSLNHSVNYLLSQILSKCNFYSFDTFIQSLKDKSNIKGLESFIKIYDDVTNNIVWLNRLYTNFRTCVIKKAGISVNDFSSMITQTNTNINDLINTRFQCINAYKITGYIVYELHDSNNKKLTDLLRTINPLNNETLANTDSIFGNEDNTVKLELINKLYEILNKIFPNISYNALVNAVNFEGKYRDNLKNLISYTRDINNSCKTIHNTIVDKLNKYNKEVTEFKNSKEKDKVYPEYPIGDSDYKGLYKLLDEFLPLIIQANPSSAEFNSSNAEGNNSSDAIIYSYINKINEKLHNPNGAEGFRRWVTQGDFYKYSTLFYGVTKNGLTKEGLFSDFGTKVNKNIDKIFDIFLFNGIKDQDTAQNSVYASMFKGDFFMSALTAFVNNHNTQKDGIKYGQNNNNLIRMANYFIRTPADSGKTFLVNAQKIDTNGLYEFDDEAGRIRIKENHLYFEAIKQNFIGELNIFISQLNNLLKKKGNTYYINESTDGLFKNAHYNETIIEEKVIDGKKVKQLSGNFFQFIKLFNVSNNSDFNQYIKSSLSLYGQGNDALIRETRNGNLVLNTNHPLISFNENKSKFELNLTGVYDEYKSVDSIINTLVRNFLENYVASIPARTAIYQSINNSLGTGKFSSHDIIDCCLNYALFYMEMDDLLEGNSKYYSGAQDFLKRAKEVLMGGTCYTHYEYENAVNGELTNVIVNNKSATFTINGVEYQVYNGYQAVTIENTVRPSKNAEVIYNEMLEVNKNIKDKSIRTKIANFIADGFRGKTKTNDAQSYITIEEFARRRFLDGTFNEYKDLLEQLMNPDIPKEDINLDEITARIQVQKNIYYDMQYSPEHDCFYPRQIKNAEFVLIPKLIPENSDLRKLYDIMHKGINGKEIGQINTVETSKAAKRNILTFWNNDGKVIYDKNGKTSLENNINSITVESYYYSNLYKQQEVPQHMQDAVSKIAVQVIKKCLDNTNEKLEGTVKRLHKTYCANIENAKNKFLNDMNWHIDSNGELKDNTGGEPKFFVFYEKAKEEAQRLGLDSNFIDYVTLDSNGIPLMPNWMPNIATKIENVFQSIFNNYITKQTLPGWHAAQITNVGYDKELKYHPAEYENNKGKVIEQKEFDSLSKEEKEKYTLKNRAWAECKIPRWSNKIPKEYNIKDLEQEGLDIHIGYRIPTEGKQSITILKVVGFLDDSQGSTIVVPDEWVTQTGSDFDIDSIYGMCYQFYKGSDGKLHKIKFNDDESLEGIKHRYITYIRKRVKELHDSIKLTSINNKDREDAINSAKEALDNENPSNEFPFVMANAKEEFKKLPKSARIAIIKENKKNKNLPFVERNRVIIEKSKNKNKGFEEITEDYINILIAIDENISDTEGYTVNYKDFKYNAVKELYEKDLENKVDICEKKASELGLYSFDEFANLSIEMQNSEEARNNRIIDSIKEILENTESREENYSRSNYDDITAANDNFRYLSGLDSVKRSTYNLLDQIDYMEDVIGGRQLKAFSVNRDTFNSICNKLKIHINDDNAIKVIYNLNDTDKDGNKLYDKNLMSYTYKNEDTENNKDRFIITYNKWAWSDTNRNIAAKLITVYGSETTAHILDTVKVGALLNENKYSFSVFKTLVDLGLDYFTIINWLTQPGISEVVNAANEVNSIYIGATYNPAMTALKRLLVKKGYKKVNDYTRSNEVFSILANDHDLKRIFNEKYGIDINDIFEKHLSENDGVYNMSVVNNIPTIIDTNLLKQNIINSYNPNHELKEDEINDGIITDIISVLQFAKLKNIASEVKEIMRCCNPDKFGAKESVRDTRRILENIEKHRNNPLLIDENGVSLLNKLYPLKGGEIDIDGSAYPYVAAYLKNVTQLSVDINSRILYLERPEFVQLEKEIENKIGKELNTVEYKAYQKYIANYVFNAVPYLNQPITITKDGYALIDLSRIYNGDNAIDVINRERLRIYGFNNTNYSNIEIADINNPNEEEIDEFNKLSPVQKVLFIQSNFIDSGLFNFIKVNTFISKSNIEGKYSSMSYNDNNTDIETMIQNFKEAFNSKNPLIRLTAIDLIKYEFITNGFKFRAGAISKLISNNSINNSITDFGLNIMSVANEEINKLALADDIDNFAQTFIRSHPEIVRTIKIEKPAKKDEVKNNGNILQSIISSADHFSILKGDTNTKSLLGKLLPDSEYKNEYIKILRHDRGKKKTVLYRVIESDTMYCFIPLDYLEENEISTYSLNNDNNKHISYEDYLEIYNKFIQNSPKKSFSTQSIKNYKVQKRSDTNENMLYVNGFKDILSSDGNAYLKGGIVRFIEEATKFFTSEESKVFPTKIVLNNNYELKQRIPVGGTIQNITLNDTNNTEVTIAIKPVNFSKYIKLLKDIINNKENKDINNTNIDALNTAAEDYSARKIEELAASYKYYKFYEISRAIEDSKEKDKENTYRKSLKSLHYDIETGPTAPNLTNRKNGLADSSIITGAQQIYNETLKAARSGNKIDEKLIDVFTKKGIDFRNTSSIVANKQSIYITAVKKYKDSANALLTEVNEFPIEVDGEIVTYPINSDELFDELIKSNNQEDINRLLNLILRCKTFGDQLNKIFGMNVVGEDIETTNAINSIISTINSINNNRTVLEANDKVFNKLFATLYSTNPRVKVGLNTILDVAHDTNWFDLQLADAAEINNKQIQVAIKVAQRMVNKAILNADTRIIEFEKEFDSIMALEDSIDWKKVIDNKGMYGKEYTEQFYTDLEKVNLEYENAIDTYGRNSIEAEKAHLNKLKFYATYIEQEYDKQYYYDVIENIQRVINKAPEFYIKYKQLMAELYGINNGFDLLTKDTRRRIIQINKEIRLLSDPDIITEDFDVFNEEGKVNSKFKDEEKLFENRLAIRDYINTRKEINDKYFNYEKDEQFEKELKYNLDIVKNYERAHKYESFESKMENDEFRKAYEWIKFNTYLRFDKQDTNKIKEAFKALNSTDINMLPNSSTRTANFVIKEIIDKAKNDISRNVIDEYGEFHPERLTKEEILKIRQATLAKTIGQDSVGGIGNGTHDSGKLIKDIDNKTPIFLASTFVSKEKEGIDSNETVKRSKIVAKINNLIYHGIDRHTGHISFRLLEENLNRLSEQEHNEWETKVNELKKSIGENYIDNEEYKKLIKAEPKNKLVELGNLYERLKSFDEDNGLNRTTKLFKLRSNPSIKVGIRLNMKAFNEEYSYYTKFVKGTALENVWLRIFTENDGSKKKPTANFDIYGYFYATNAKGEQVNTIIDTKRTAARDFINNNLEFVPNYWYYEQQQHYEDYGYDSYDEWFDANHYYDIFTHKMVPLRIWTEMTAKEGSKVLKATRVQKDTRLQKEIKDEYRNPNYRKNVLTYRKPTQDDINNKNSLVYGSQSLANKYSSGISFTNKERQMIDLLKQTALKYGTTRIEQLFTERGYAPRRVKSPEITGKYVVKQALGVVGIEYGFVKHEYDNDIDFVHQHEIENNMMHIIKSKGSQEYEQIKPKSVIDTDEDYRKYVNEVKERNAKIKEANLKIDNALFDNDWKSVFKDFIKVATVTEAKEKSKDSIFLTIEDLKDRKIPVKSRYTGNLVKNVKESTDTTTNYKETSQKNSLEAFQNWSRRFLYEQYKKGSNLDSIANLMQNITSAKYMILNLPGGISNIATGLTNIAGEIFAKENFDAKDFAEAQAEYIKNIPSFMKDMWNTTSDNLLVAICKRLNIVDYDAIVERKEGEGYSEYVSRIEELLYGFQSGGEHYMQNTALISMLNSNRIFKYNGKYTIGTFDLYTNTIDFAVINELLDTKYQNLKEHFNARFKDDIADKNKKRRYDELRDDFVLGFVKEFSKGENANLASDYVALLKQELTRAKEKFNTLPKLKDQFILKDGIAQIKEDCIALKEVENIVNKQDIANQLIADMQDKCRKVNNKIHGVYYKLGSARIENEWWGGLVMQYHKHIYPGIMKRYRTTGYYNEIRQTNELGSYVSLAKFLTIEFRNINKNKNLTDEEKDTNKLLKGIQGILKATVDTIVNLKINWQLLPTWEQNNIRRTYGDLCGITAAMLTAIGIHLACDDDELKDDTVKGNLLSTCIYLSDRLYSESRMYTPTGMYNEFDVLWSSPIAATNGPEDLLKGLNVIVNTLFNEDYEPNYTTGLYKGQNKAAVVLKRNIPAYRVYNRLKHMSENNQYYRINDNSLNMRTATNIVNAIKGN